MGDGVAPVESLVQARDVQDSFSTGRKSVRNRLVFQLDSTSPEFARSPVVFSLGGISDRTIADQISCRARGLIDWRMRERTGE